MIRTAMLAGSALAAWLAVAPASAQPPVGRPVDPVPGTRPVQVDPIPGTRPVDPAVRPGTATRPVETTPATTANQVPATQPADNRGGQAQRTFRAKDVLSTKVSIQGGLAVGTVDDIVFADDGMIEYLIVQNEGKLVSVPYQAAQFNFEQRSATVNITQEQYKAIPTYTTQQYPNFAAPTYQEQTYKFYGVTPRAARQVDRALDRGDRRDDRRDRR